MGKALELVSGFATAPSSTFTALTMCTGNSATIRNAPAKLVAMSALQQATAGFFRIRSPLLHDTTNGIRYSLPVSVASGVIHDVVQDLEPQDTLTLEATGSATAGDIEHRSIHVFYEDLPGVNANLITLDELKRRFESLYVVPVTLTAGITTGQYGDSLALNSGTDQFRANMDYAIIGVTSASGSGNAGVRISGPDTGNLGVGVPILAGQEEDLCANWFARIAMRTGLPTIPVVNAANKASTFLQLYGNENVGATTIGLVMALLKNGSSHIDSRIGRGSPGRKSRR